MNPSVGLWMAKCPIPQHWMLATTMFRWLSFRRKQRLSAPLRKEWQPPANRQCNIAAHSLRLISLPMTTLLLRFGLALLSPRFELPPSSHRLLQHRLPRNRHGPETPCSASISSAVHSQQRIVALPASRPRQGLGCLGQTLNSLSYLFIPSLRLPQRSMSVHLRLGS